MNKHTPGPWTARATPNDCDFAYEIDGVASVYRGGGAANASLIAAAPELLEALELVRDLASKEWQEADGSRKGATDNRGQRLWFISPDVMDAVADAIAKAEGSK